MRISDWSSDVCSSDLIGAVIVAVPEAADMRECARGPFMPPTQRRRLAAVENRAPVRPLAARREQHAMADRRHGLVGGEEVGHQLLQDRAFQIFAHPAPPMAAAPPDRVMAVHNTE